MPKAILHAVDFRPELHSFQSIGPNLTINCAASGGHTVDIYWGENAFVWPDHYTPNKALVTVTADRQPSYWWWLAMDDYETSRAPREDAGRFLEQTENASTLAAAITNMERSGEIWARFETTGMNWAIDQLDCAPVPKSLTAVANARLSVVHVETHDSGGSGVVIETEGGRSKVITAWHVIDSYCRGQAPCVGITVVQDNQRYHAALVDRYEAQDIALLDVEGTLPAIPMAMANPPIQSRVITTGMPDGEHDFQFNEGIVVGHGGCSGISSCVRTNALAVSGFSGGALINEEGVLVGVVAQRYRGSNYSNAVGIVSVRGLLEGRVFSSS